MEGGPAMKNLDEYIKEGRVVRSKVAMAVVKGDLTRHDIIELCKDSRMKAVFIGSSYSPKCSNDHWTRDYIDELVCASVAESFNQDYLLYLEKVVSYMKEKEKNKLGLFWKVVAGIIGVAAIAGVIIGCVHSFKDQEAPEPAAVLMCEIIWCAK